MMMMMMTTTTTMTTKGIQPLKSTTCQKYMAPRRSSLMGFYHSCRPKPSGSIPPTLGKLKGKTRTQIEGMIYTCGVA